MVMYRNGHVPIWSLPVVNVWKSMPNWVVTAESTNIFKTRLDTFWHNQDNIMYDFRAQEGTGSRSEI